ncbi:MAG: flagellin [Alphaproteobacteria bacterium]|nr:flagellin [Alphaproteobacteria bacterium]MDX5369034.1 flagellin [Alphaproteobacteria bacterium]MDX5463737.1 flagellin [Alphaproteobacteria bacterium]
MSSILTNNGAMVALQTMKNINANLSKVSDQISTGKKVGSARDNSAIWAISTTMDSDVTGFKAISEQLSLGNSTVAVARNGAETITSLLNEMKEKIVSAQSSSVDRSKLQTDIEVLRDQINSVVSAAQFNGTNLLKDGGSIDVLASLDRATDGTVSASNINVARQNLETTEMVYGSSGALSVTTASAASIADGASETVTFAGGEIVEGDSFQVSVGGVDYQYVARDGDTLNEVGAALTAKINDAGIDGVTVTLARAADPATDDVVLTVANASGAAVALAGSDESGGTAGGGLEALASIDVTSDAGATQALTDIEGLIQTAIDASASFGASQKRLDIQSDFVGKLMDSMKSGIGSLVDADMEEASARLQALQVQQQLGIQALSIANQAPQNILALFR